MELPPLSNFRIFSSTQKETPYLLAVTAHSLLAWPLATTNLFSVYGFGYYGHFTYVDSFNMWLWVSDFFHLAQCFQGSAFIGLNNRLLHGYFVCPFHFVYPFINWRTFELSLAIMNRTATNICVQVFVWTYVFNSLVYRPRSGITGSGGNYI